MGLGCRSGSGSGFPAPCQRVEPRRAHLSAVLHILLRMIETRLRQPSGWFSNCADETQGDPYLICLHAACLGGMALKK